MMKLTFRFSANTGLFCDTQVFRSRVVEDKQLSSGCLQFPWSLNPWKVLEGARHNIWTEVYE
jgi:hypothetical protein